MKSPHFISDSYKFFARSLDYWIIGLTSMLGTVEVEASAGNPAWLDVAAA
jgi:hypothetical protein